jgi:hypothetical protein
MLGREESCSKIEEVLPIAIGKLRSELCSIVTATRLGVR